jgi:hypothetical protein
MVLNKLYVNLSTYSLYEYEAFSLVVSKQLRLHRYRFHPLLRHPQTAGVFYILLISETDKVTWA